MRKTSLVDAVQATLDKNEEMFSPQALEALRLSDKFESVTAPEYILPLDAMAGFPKQVTEASEFAPRPRSLHLAPPSAEIEFSSRSDPATFQHQWLMRRFLIDRDLTRGLRRRNDDRL